MGGAGADDAVSVSLSLGPKETPKQRGDKIRDKETEWQDHVA